MGRVALFRARRSGDDSLVAVLVRELRDGLRLRLAAARAGEGFDAGLSLRRLLGHFAIVPCVAERVRFLLHRQNCAADGTMLAFCQAGFCAGRSLCCINGFRVAECGDHSSLDLRAAGICASARPQAGFRAGRGFRHRPCAKIMNLCVIMLCGVDQGIICMANLNGIPLRFGSGIIYVFQIIAAHKDPVRELCDPFRDSNRFQMAAIRKRAIRNACYTGGNLIRCRHFSGRITNQLCLPLIKQNTVR